MIDFSGLLEFLALVAGTGLFVAIFNQSIQSYRDARERKRAAEDFALKSAALLERFAHRSLDIAADIDSQLAMGSNPYDISCELAELEEYSLELEGWRGLRKNEAASLVNLRLKIENDARALAANAWHEDTSEAVNMYRNQNILSAADAWHVGMSLREAYDLPKHGKIDARDPDDLTTDYLERELNTIHAREEAAIEARAESQRQLRSGSASDTA